MKRVLTFASLGLFAAGLALVPLSARADQTVSSGKDGKPVAASTTAPAPVGGTVTAPVTKADGHKVTAAPPASGGMTVAPPAGASGASTVKPPVKSGS
ncbi:MAG: hypothetical protein EXR07_09970 [Acetobacteraceae bacterium]|nr:hypothetical protein [Acetobacteraceae bacterium]